MKHGKSKPKYFNLNLIFKLLFLLLVFIFGIIIMGNILSRNSTENFILQINREISFIFVNFFETQKKLSFEKFHYLDGHPVHVFQRRLDSYLLGGTSVRTV